MWLNKNLYLFHLNYCISILLSMQFIQRECPPCWGTLLTMWREFMWRRPKRFVPALPRKLFSRFNRDALALMKWQTWMQNNRRQSCKNGWPGALYGKGPAPLKVKEFLRKHNKSQIFVKLLLELGVVKVETSTFRSCFKLYLLI